MRSESQSALLDLHGRVQTFAPFKVVLVGDYMLDRQIRGTVDRISPEAPVPVLTSRSQADFESSPGGSGNVAACLAALSGVVHCIGVVGDDPDGGLLRTGLESIGCVTEGLVEDSTRPTTLKQSMVGLAQHRHPQKMFRFDIESTEPLSAECEQRLLDALAKALPGSAVVCLEDYGKGVCSPRVCEETMRMATELGIPVMVDPASRDSFERYSGAALITPNRSEAERALGGGATPSTASSSGVEHGRSLAERLHGSLDVSEIVVTIDRDGAVYSVDRGTEPVHVATRARHVYDVTGAGDVVLAVLAACKAHSMGIHESVQLANIAAGLEVETFGVRPIPLGELSGALLDEARGGGRERDLPTLLDELDQLRREGKRVVLTNGCFDVIHAGHVAYLREAGMVGDVLVVGLNSDEQVRIQKGADRPIFNATERLEILGELRCIDYLVIFEEPTAESLIRAIRPDVYVKGGDYQPEEIAEYGLLTELGIETRVLASRPGLGSSALIDRIRSQSGA